MPESSPTTSSLLSELEMDMDMDMDDLSDVSITQLLDRLQLHNPKPYSDTDSLISAACDKVVTDTDDGKSALAKETAKLEQKLIRTILGGNAHEVLKANSGQSVEVGGHHICVGCSDKAESGGYKVWQWHGHIMLFDDDDGFRLEYVYGNYFQKVKKDEEDGDSEEEDGDNGGVKEENSVLRELMEKADEINARILCRNISLAARR